MQLTSLLRFILFLLFFQTFFANAADLFLFPDTLTLNQGNAHFDWSNRFKRGSTYFNDTKSGALGLYGDKTSLFPNNTQETYIDASSTLFLAYGWTDTFTLYADVPFRYRKESKTYRVDALGVADITVGLRYGIAREKQKLPWMAVDVAAKFPTGKSSIGFNDASQGISATLPLGTGNTDLSAAFIFQQFAGSSFEFQQVVNYTYRIKALTQYLTSTNFSFSDSNGNVYALPVGNLEIKWGDEIEVQAGTRARLHERLFLSLTASYLWRFNTTVDSFVFTPSGGSTDASRQEILFSQSHYLSGTLELSYRASSGWIYALGWSHPILGRNYPIASLAFVESLLGETFSLGLSRAF